MTPDPDPSTWAKEMKKKIEAEMTKKEIEAVLYWREELEKILLRRPESLASFQTEVQNLLQRMNNRIRILKGSLQK